MMHQLAVAALACAAFLPFAHAAGTVVVVTSFAKEVTDPIKAAYEAANPGYKLDVQNRNTNAGVKYVEETRANNRTDLFWASAPDAFEGLKSRKLLADFRPSVTGLPQKVGAYPINDPDGKYFGFAASGYGIMWNERYLRANRLAAPAEWSDLTKPAYHGHVSIAAPSRSGTTHLTIETILQGEGWDKGWGTLKAVGGNLHSVTERSFGVPDAVNSGQIGIGIVIDFFALSAAASGFPVKFAYPSVTTVVPANVAILENAPNREGAERFINFLLSEKGQEVLLEPSIRRLPVNPAAYKKAPEGYPNPFTDARFQKMITFDSAKSGTRTAVVDTLYDQLVTFQLDALKAATKAIFEAEEKNGKNAKAQALIAEARALVAAMPVTEAEASAGEIREAFRGGADAKTRQAQHEQRWAKFAADNYSQARAKAQEALRAR